MSGCLIGDEAVSVYRDWLKLLVAGRGERLGGRGGERFGVRVDSICFRDSICAARRSDIASSLASKRASCSASLVETLDPCRL